MYGIARRAVLSFFAIVLVTSETMAESIADFYAGKQMQMIIRSAAGSGYDQYARLFSRHVVRHIPGAPTIINQNMPGGGGITAANYVYSVAPNDGTVITIVSQGLPAAQALGQAKGLTADMGKFNWLGTLVSSNQLTVTWKNSQTRTFEDARKRETVIGTVGAGSISAQIPILLNKFTGTKLRLVTGYKGTGDLAIAMERGEIDGFAALNLATMGAVFPSYLAEKKVQVIVQMGAKRDSRLADVPLMSEVALSEDGKKVIGFFSRGVVVGRPLATGPTVPKDRVAALREAFDKTMKDAAFLAEAKKQNIEIEPTGWQELTDIVNGTLTESKEVLDMARAAFQ